jgi:hypothetical protein
LIIVHLCVNLELNPVEQEHELQVELAPVEDVTNTFPEQGKSQCIPTIFLDFGFIK